MKPFIKSEPIPETNNEPVKVVVANSLKDMVLESKKNSKILSMLSSFFFLIICCYMRSKTV